jgi:hypothetical protein
VELDSAKVQAMERAPIGQHFLHTLLSLSISLVLFTKTRSYHGGLIFLLIAGSDPDDEEAN